MLNIVAANFGDKETLRDIRNIREVADKRL